MFHCKLAQRPIWILTLSFTIKIKTRGNFIMRKCTLCNDEIKSEKYSWCMECVNKFKETPDTAVFFGWAFNRVREIERNKTDKIIKAAENLIAACNSVVNLELSSDEKEPQDLLQEEIDKYRQQND